MRGRGGGTIRERAVTGEPRNLGRTKKDTQAIKRTVVVSGVPPRAKRSGVGNPEISVSPGLLAGEKAGRVAKSANNRGRQELSEQLEVPKPGKLMVRA